MKNLQRVSVDGLTAEYLCSLHQFANCFHLSWYKVLVVEALALMILLETFSDRPFFLVSLMITSMRSSEDLTDLDVELLTLVEGEGLSLRGGFSEPPQLGPSGLETTLLLATMELSLSLGNSETS